MELILDSNRNALLALDLKVSILTMGIGVGTLVAGVFGMNVSRQIRVVVGSSVPTIINTCCEQLRSHLEEHEFAFYAMTATAFAVSLGAAWIGVRRYGYALSILVPELTSFDIGFLGYGKLGCQAIAANDR